MTERSTTAAADLVARPDLWGVGRYRDGAGLVEFPIGWSDHERDVTWARQALLDHGLKAGGVLLTNPAEDEVPWFDPIHEAARSLGAPVCVGDAVRSDAFRTAMYLRRLDVAMVVGLTRVVADWLVEQDLVILLDGVAVFARPDAALALRARGGDPFLFTTIGPATAIECTHRGGVHVNGADWAVDVVSGSIRLTTVGPRQVALKSAPTGLDGVVVAGPCACGSRDPLVCLQVDDDAVLDPAARTGNTTDGQ